ncbi:N,N-dimethylformamidase beta subunit family domain-containing protein [Mesorhizobium sp.]|uniref:N,N-dimethylformamidase beta subunit family domain-containing protein n=1 Tax=Mesorhizobium sp. TaxID=1871066 RepID=UPI00257A77E4|nr:N,N-dimethylformamidase beta subunit family domain-containing protein [Mesorhizobium sp.]
MIDTVSVLGYADPLSAAPGEKIRFYLGSSSLRQADLCVVRVRCADPDPDGPGLRLLQVPSAVDGTVGLRSQPIHPGSCARVDNTAALPASGSVSFGCYLFPTLPGDRVQTIAAHWSRSRHCGWRLEIGDDGHLHMTVACKGREWTAKSSVPLLAREWAFVAGVVDTATGTVLLHQQSLSIDGGRDRTASAAAGGPTEILWPAGSPFVMGAICQDAPETAGHTSSHFNGKIDRPRLFGQAVGPETLRAVVEAITPGGAGPAALGFWDFSEGIETDLVTDRSGNGLNGVLLQGPMRAVTGANWDGRSMCWREVPWQYGAIHFHDDDLTDCGWAPSVELTVPDGWCSGFYALRISARPDTGPAVESYVSFFVRPPRGCATAPVLVVASTATFLAYGNISTGLEDPLYEVPHEGLVTLGPDDVYLYEHRELGLSTYDTHRDGSGSCFSSGRRPILNMRPRGDAFNYGNDTHLLDWLEQKDITYDVVTDEDIHREGASVLQHYRAVITGSHPEYVSREMLDAFEAYQNAGGRHLYLGGNGFYWRIAFHPVKSGLIEIRRGFSGTRTWEGEAGENHLSFTGEPGGLWRTSGRAPQRLVGVGFAAQAFNRSTFYRRMPASFDPRAAFVFEGIGADEQIGNFGLRGGGAAGLETDRADRDLGSPPGLLLLASADSFGYDGLPAVDEIRITHRGLAGDQNAQIRADMVFFETAAGGAVFATGSIAWCCALSHADYENSVSRITENVLRRFLDPAPFRF